MEPNLITGPKLMAVLSELVQREPIFHRPEFGTSRADFENMTEPSFWEVGASGRRYSRDYILDLLEKRYENPSQDIWEAKDFHCTEIAPDNYLLTYTLLQDDRLTRRSTIWRRDQHNWKIVYHQGTIVE
jgi:hypothetical protein